jgi:hypothetical protein
MSQHSEFATATISQAIEQTYALSKSLYFPEDTDTAPDEIERATTWLFSLPFDLVREQYAMAVKAGALPNSLLASRDVGQTLDNMEKATLGPWARGN